MPRTPSCPAPLAALALGLLAAGPAHAAGANDAAMLQLADLTGCTACHQMQPGGHGADGQPLIGPAWRDVSSKYSGQAGADRKLLALVMDGGNPMERHWRDKAPGVQMPAHQKDINEADARLLVHWILNLEAQK